MHRLIIIVSDHWLNYYNGEYFFLENLKRERLNGGNNSLSKIASSSSAFKTKESSLGRIDRNKTHVFSPPHFVIYNDFFRMKSLCCSG